MSLDERQKFFSLPSLTPAAGSQTGGPGGKERGRAGASERGVGRRRRSARERLLSWQAVEQAGTAALDGRKLSAEPDTLLPPLPPPTEYPGAE